MAMILEFRHPGNDLDEPGVSREPVKHLKGRSAEIIIFPGVRIERQKEQTAHNAVPRTKKRATRAARRKP